MSQANGSHHDLADLLGDGPDDLDSDPPTGVSFVKDTAAQSVMAAHAAKLRRHERRTGNLTKAIQHVHGVATDARDDVREIKTMIGTAIRTLQIVGAVLAALGALAMGVATIAGYALAHFTLH